jgi:hypothetical protein
LQKYDLSYIIEGLIDHPEIGNRNIEILAKNKIRYSAVTLYKKLRIIDSLNIIPCSLKAMADDMNRDEFILSREHYGEAMFDRFMGRKTEFPYSFLNSVERLDYPEPPPRDAFASDLDGGDGISEEDYNSFCDFWRDMRFETLSDLLKSYNINDGLILADGILAHRNYLFEQTGLCVLHYFSAASFAQDHWLFMSGASIPHLPDPSFVAFFESCKMGGLSQALTPYRVWENQLVGNVPQDADFQSYGVFIDLISSYCSAQLQLMPSGGYRWLTPDELNTISDVEWIRAYDETATKTGYFVTVHLRYPERLFRRDQSFTLIPEHRNISVDDLSPIVRDNIQQAGIHRQRVTRKLTTTFLDKEHYTLSMTSLQFYLKHGIELVRILKGCICDLDYLTRDFALFWNRQRREATTPTRQRAAKNYPNFNYGKLGINVRRFTDIKIVRDEDRFMTLTADPRFASCAIFGDNFAVVQLHKKRATFNSPLAMAAQILCRSKITLQEIWVENFIPTFGSEHVSVDFLDTDSLCTTVRVPKHCQDTVYDMIKKTFPEKFDFSNFDRNHPCFDDSRKGMLGLWKFECGDVPLTSLVTLSSKCYALLSLDQQPKMKAKGTPRRVAKKELLFEHYKACVLESRPKHVSYFKIQADKTLKLHTTRCSRLSLAFANDKRFILPVDATGRQLIQSLPYGHPDIDGIRAQLEAEADAEEQ